MDPIPTPPMPPPTPTAVWTCQALQLDATAASNAQPVGELTVGETFLLSCGGGPAPLDAKLTSLRLPKGSEHLIRLLEARALDANHAAFVATAYLAGDLKPVDVFLGDGTSLVRLEGIQLKVKSVINPQETPGPKPYGPVEPLAIGYPAWIWLAFAAVMAVGAAVVARKVKRRSEHRRLKDTLAAHPIVGSAYAHFNREMRLAGRKYPPRSEAGPARDYVAELDRAFRWLVARELLVPSLEGGPHGALAELARRNPKAHRAHAQVIARTLSELTRALRPGAPVTMTDGQQLAELCRKAADAIRDAGGEARA